MPPPLKYNKMLGFSTMKGEKYEVKLAALLFLRLWNSPKIAKFQIATNVCHAGAFDDVLVRFTTIDDVNEWFTTFTQLKHTERFSLSVAILTQSKDFKLIKYLNSYVHIKEVMSEVVKPVLFDGSFEKCGFFVFTCAPLNRELLGRNREHTSSEMETLLKLDFENEKIVQFDEVTDKDIVSSLLVNDIAHEDVNGFLGSFRLFSGQPVESQLDRYIEREMVVACQVVTSGIDKFVRIYLAKVEKWWCESNLILDDNSDILAETVQEAKISSLTSKVKYNFTLNVKFESSHLVDMSTAVHVSLTHIIPAEIAMIKLCCSKVLQSAHSSYIFLSLDELLKNTGAVMLTWGRSRTTPTLLIVSDSLSEHADLCAILCGVLQNSPDKRIVIVSLQGDPFTLRLRENLTGKCREIYDDFQLSHLDFGVRDQLLNKLVSFQGHTIALGEMLDSGLQCSSGVFRDDFIQTALSNDTLAIGSYLPEVIKFYIPRTLQRHDIITCDIFKTTNVMDVYVVSNISKEELQKLVPRDEKVGDIDKGDISDCRYLVVETSNFLDIADYFQKTTNVHLLSMNNSELNWIQTRGNIKHVQQFVDKSKPSNVFCKSALDVYGKVSLLVDGPGMGKSVLMSWLAQETKQTDPSLWVIRVNLNNHMNLFDSSGKVDGVSLLTAAIGVTATEQALLEHSVKHQGNVVILVDGFDEIAPEYTDKCCLLLTNLLKMKARKIWVTTRPSMKNKLERLLSTLAITLHKFNESDQRAFLKKFWSCQIKPFPMTDTELKMFTSKLLPLLTRSFNDKQSQFMGVPLQTMMIAEIFANHIITPEKALPEHLDLLTLFEMLIDKKFKFYFGKKIPSSVRNIKEIEEGIRKIFHEFHINAALVLIFNESKLNLLGHDVKCKILREFDKTAKNFQVGIDDKGIIDSIVGHTPIFLHRTFAEYYVALWLNNSHQMYVEFTRAIFFNKEYQVVRNVLDLMLARKSKLHTAIVLDDPSQVEMLLSSEGAVNSLDKGRRTPLHLAAVTDFKCAQNYDDIVFDDQPRSLLILLNKQKGAKCNNLDNVLQWTPLEYAINSKSWDAVELLLDETNEEYNFALYDKHIKKFKSPLLHISSAYGFVKIVRLLVRAGVNVDSTDDLGATPLHATCASRRGSVNLVNALFERFAVNRKFVSKFINAQDSKGNSALHHACKRAHCEIVEFLLLQNANVLTCNLEGETPLHIYFVHNSLPIVKMLVEYLEDKQLSVTNYINTSDKHGWSTIHWAAWSKNVKVLTYLILKGGNIWARDEQGRTPLFICCEHDGLACARSLVTSLGEDKEAVRAYVNVCEVSGQSPLHVASNHDIQALLIENGGDVWSSKYWGSTPLHKACKEGDLKKVQILLDSFGDDLESSKIYVSTPDPDGKSAANWAYEFGNTKMTRLLSNVGGENCVDCVLDVSGSSTENKLRNGLEFILELEGNKIAIKDYINTCDGDGRTILHWASEVGDVQAIEQLISKGADIWALDNNQLTPFHVACFSNRLYAASTLIDTLGDNKEYVNLGSANGWTALTLAAKRGHCDILKFLLSKGANIWIQDKRGSTPLHMACWYGYLDATQILVDSLQNNVERVRKFISTHNLSNQTPLHCASIQGHSSVINYLITKCGNIWAKDLEGLTPLMWACLKHRAEAVHVLFESLSDDEAKTKEYLHKCDAQGQSSIHFASIGGNPDIVELLINKGANIWTRNKEGSTPLHLACMRGHLDTCQVLIGSLGDDKTSVRNYVNILNANNRTSLNLAHIQEHTGIVSYLEDKGGTL